MAKFEEVLPALREGKKVRKNSWGYGAFICIIDGSLVERNSELFYLNGHSILGNDWEIYEEPKKKVKYYPGLFLSSSGHCVYSLYKDEQDVKNDVYVRSMQFIRLITEIPELIEEREE